jgi:hypothetical protein
MIPTGELAPVANSPFDFSGDRPPSAFVFTLNTNN